MKMYLNLRGQVVCVRGSEGEFSRAEGLPVFNEILSIQRT